MAYITNALDKNGNKTGFYNLNNSNSSQKSASSVAQTVAKNNEAYARALQYNVGNPSAAQYSGLTTRDDYAVKDKYDAIKGNNTNPTGSGTATTQAQTQTGSGFDTIGYLNSLYESYAAQRQAQLEEAYNRARNSLNSGYDSATGLLSDNYNSARDTLNSTYKNSKSNIQADALRSLKQAYANNVLQNKNLAQQLAAQGLSGGASETTLANRMNNYENTRNDITDQRASNLANLVAERNQNLASILQGYNTNLANLQQQKASALSNLEMALANSQLDALDKQFSFQTSSGYLDALNNAMTNMAQYQANPYTVNNEVTPVSTQQTGVTNITNSTNYAELQKMLEQLLASSQA